MDVHQAFDEWIREQVIAEMERLESDCMIAMLLQDYNYLDRLHIARLPGSAGHIASRI